MLIGLSPCERHADGNVGDQLIAEVTMDLITEIHGDVDYEIYFKGEDLTSRIDHVNEADAILLLGFEIQRDNTWPDEYRIADDLDAVEPPLIPICSSYSFFPGDEAELRTQFFGPGTIEFLERVREDCPGGKIPVRDEWVGLVLQQNGFRTVLTGDPGWYDPDYVGRPFHRPNEIDKLVFTTPHSHLFVDQAKSLLRRLSRRFDDSERILSLHSGTRPVDRKLFDTAREHDWRIHHASHETRFLEVYRDSDLHVGYRLHGHLAHLRWRRPSIALAEDSRVRGLTETFGVGGVPAFKSREMTGITGILRRLSESQPVVGGHLLLKKFGIIDPIPYNSPLKATADTEAVDNVLSRIDAHLARDWKAFEQVGEVIDETYMGTMRPYLSDVM